MICAVLAAFAVQAPAMSGAWIHWQSWRPIETGPATQPTLVRFALPIAVYGAAQVDFGDIRVIDGSGQEVPFVIASPGPTHTQVTTAAKLFDTGFVPRQYTQAVADVGESATLHNLLTLEIPADERDFFEWVSVEASDDRHTWRIVRERAPVFRFQSEGLPGQQTVTFPQTASRWLRIRVLDGQKPFPLEGVMVSRDVETIISREPLNAPVTLNPQSPEHKSLWDADAGVKGVPVSLVSFTATQGAFHRPVMVSTSDDGVTFTEVAQGDIYRDSGYEHLGVEVPAGRGRYWRVTVFNRNDAPIDGLRVGLMITPLYVVFRQVPGRDYFLLYGNTRATAPQYDFATLTTREQESAASVVSVGPESKNTAYQSPEPWTERHGWLLWAALLAAVVVVGVLAIRSMRPAGTS